MTIDYQNFDFEDQKLVLKVATELARSEIPPTNPDYPMLCRILVEAVRLVDSTYPEMLDRIATTDTRMAEVIEHFNLRTDRSLLLTKSRVQLMKKVLSQGYSAADMIAVIDFKIAEMGLDWSYLRPETLFAQKNFDRYMVPVNALRRAEAMDSEGI